MNRLESEIFYALLRKSLFGTPIDYSTWEDGKWAWEPIITAAEENRLYPLFLEAVTSLPEQLKPTHKIYVRLAQFTGKNMQVHNKMNADICTAFNLLTQNGFRPILMKGQANATFYPNPMLRMSGDVDIYIGKDYKAATQLLIEKLPNTEEGFDSHKHIRITTGKTEIELHQYAEIVGFPQNNKAYQKLVDYWFAQPDYVNINGQQIPIPPYQFLPVYVFNHLWHHFNSSGVGLRQFCDVAMILHKLHGQLDLNRIKQDLKDIGLFHEWQIGGWLIVNLLGLPKEEFPFYKETDMKHVWALSDLIITDGNFSMNRYKDVHKGFVKHFIDSSNEHIDRAKRMYEISPSLGASYLARRGGQCILHIVQGKWKDL